MVLLTQYSVPDHLDSREMYQNVLCSTVWVISNSLAVSAGALCLGCGGTGISWLILLSGVVCLEGVSA